MLKFYGDIPKADLAMVEELKNLEQWFYDHGTDLEALAIGKGMVCMAHDYYDMEMEEEGDRLLYMAEKYCPGYFTAPIYIAMEKDKNFANLVMNLRRSMGFEIMKKMGFL